ncbi:MAG: class I SAM-dependent methyltransferase [bacterium]|nr:class I SAM-dependent methyltransferase [bacterium]
MQSSLYTASHRADFEVFFHLVDDTAVQTAALLNVASWHDVRSLLSIGGGKGIVETFLLRQAPHAHIWYLDPSPEQCHVFRHHLRTEQLGDRVEEVVQTTFQAYATHTTFDRILSMFSWYFMGTDTQWFRKLLDLLSPDGVACLVLPNTASIFADFTRSLSPNTCMTLVGDDVVQVLKRLDCTVTHQTGTKWLAHQDLFAGDTLSEASLAFAAFVSMRPASTFTEEDKAHIIQLLTAKQDSQGVPLIWDLLCVTR